MPRSIWNGAVAFGLVTVPVKVYSATDSKAVRFHEVHVKDGSRIEHRRICPNDGQQVGYDDVVRGFEVSEGRWVELTDEDVAAAAGPRTKLIDVDDFVPVGDIDPVYFDRAYYLGAQAKGEDGYALVLAALERSGRAGVGRWVFHNRERTVLLRPFDGVLALHVMRFADEIVDPREFELRAVGRKPSDREVRMALALVEELHTGFDPCDYEDTHRDALLKLIERKAAGEEIAPPEHEEPEPADDLLAALEASLANA